MANGTVASASIRPLANAVRRMGGKSDIKIAEALDAIDSHLASLGSSLAAVSTLNSISLTIQQVTLTADVSGLSAAASPAASGALLLLIITQDGTGGHELTLGSGFDSSAQIAVDPGANVTTRQLFFGKSGSPWAPVALPSSF